MKTLISNFLFSLLFFVAAGCLLEPSDERIIVEPEAEPEETDGNSEEKISFAEISPILERNCAAQGGCHSSSDPTPYFSDQALFDREQAENYRRMFELPPAHPDYMPRESKWTSKADKDKVKRYLETLSQK